MIENNCEIKARLVGQKMLDFNVDTRRVLRTRHGGREQNLANIYIPPLKRKRKHVYPMILALGIAGARRVEAIGSKGRQNEAQSRDNEVMSITHFPA